MTTTTSVAYAVKIGMKGEDYVLPFIKRNFIENVKSALNERLSN